MYSIKFSSLVLITTMFFNLIQVHHFDRRIKQMSFYKGRFTTNLNPNVLQLNCKSSTLCNFEPDVIICKNEILEKTIIWSCQANLNKDLYLKNYNVNCEYLKDLYWTPGTCYLNYEIQQVTSSHLGVYFLVFLFLVIISTIPLFIYFRIKRRSYTSL